MLLVRVFRHPIVCFKKGAVFDIFFMIAVGATSPDSVAGEGCYPLFLWYLLQVLHDLIVSLEKGSQLCAPGNECGEGLHAFLFVYLFQVLTHVVMCLEKGATPHFFVHL